MIDAHGETALHIRDVAAACGVTSPIVYKAFGSREGLIVAAQSERYIRSWRDSSHGMPEAIANATTVDELKQAILDVVMRILGPDRHIYRRVRHEILGSLVHLPALQKAVVDLLATMRRTFADAFGVAQRRCLIRQDLDVDAAFLWYLGQVEGRFMVELDPASVNERAWNKIFIEAIFFSLFTDPTVPIEL